MDTGLLQGLEKAFQRQEKELVVELAADRVLHYVSVYITLILATISKVTELTGNNLMCYPTQNVSGYGRAFVNHATSYCWESSQNSKSFRTSTNSSTAYDESTLLLQDSSTVKNVVHWMPYWLLLQVFLLALPSASWHFLVGARLMGHIKFMQRFLNEIYDSLKIIPAGIYRGKPYDEESIYFDGWRPFNKEYKKEQQQGLNPDNEKSDWKKKNDPRKEEKIYGNKAILTVENVSNAAAYAEFTEEESDEETTVTVENKHDSANSILDKHLFSMLCYENFASLEHHPYIMSVYQLTSTGAAHGDHRGVFPMKHGILRQFCHEDNFTCRFLVKIYIYKNLYRSLMSLILLAISLVFFFLGFQTFTTKTFRCDIPFHDVGLVCTLKGHWDMIAIVFVNSFVLIFHFALSSFQVYFVGFGSNRALSHYFSDIMDSFSVALLSAHKAAHEL